MNINEAALFAAECTKLAFDQKFMWIAPSGDIYVALESGEFAVLPCPEDELDAMLEEQLNREFDEELKG